MKIKFVCQQILRTEKRQNKALDKEAEIRLLAFKNGADSEMNEAREKKTGCAPVPAAAALAAARVRRAINKPIKTKTFAAEFVHTAAAAAAAAEIDKYGKYRCDTK